jgi:hypothetical protein
MPDLTVYRSTHPTVLAARDTHKQAVTQWRAEATKLLTELGFPGRQWITGTAFGDRWLIGITPRDHIELPPRGWRRARVDGHDVFKPDRRTSGGKAIATRLIACKPPAEPNVNLPGMPAEIEDPAHNRVHEPGIREMDGAVWVTWSIAPPARRVDPALWEPIRLSVYYAAVERQQDSKEPTHVHA